MPPPRPAPPWGPALASPPLASLANRPARPWEPALAWRPPARPPRIALPAPPVRPVRRWPLPRLRRPLPRRPPAPAKPVARAHTAPADVSHPVRCSADRPSGAVFLFKGGQRAPDAISFSSLPDRAPKVRQDKTHGGHAGALISAQDSPFTFPGQENRGSGRGHRTQIHIDPLVDAQLLQRLAQRAQGFLIRDRKHHLEVENRRARPRARL